MVQPEWWQVVRRRLLPNHRSRAPHRYFCQRTEWRTLYHSRNFSDKSNATFVFCVVEFFLLVLLQLLLLLLLLVVLSMLKIRFSCRKPASHRWRVVSVSSQLVARPNCGLLHRHQLYCTPLYNCTPDLHSTTLHSISWSISNCQVNKHQINTTKIHPWSPSYKWQWQMAWLKTLVTFNWKHYISHAFQSQLTY